MTVVTRFTVHRIESVLIDCGEDDEHDEKEMRTVYLCGKDACTDAGGSIELTLTRPDQWDNFKLGEEVTVTIY